VRIADPAQPVTPPAAWTIAGQPMHKPDAQAFVTGRHRFTTDLTLPGMLIGKVLRPPAFRATLLEVDVSAAAAMPGVTVVHAGDFVGVAAPDELTADARHRRHPCALADGITNLGSRAFRLSQG
jgi:nicotinate dehydrogenase subunit B